ncbi:hypothetical protein [Empedobacter tilapiae]|uniref:hypothetical protein n=1 Tax=Empedobacter tilapiae TaxID=2491114 RepID=UPI0028D0517C|nr:hypothetical protein [Empedobacter tilapiae]
MMNLYARNVIAICVICSFNNVKAQVGIGTESPNISSSLDISSQNTGVLIPRVNLLATNLPSPINNPENSLLIFNLSNNGLGRNAVSPGYYYWSKKTDNTGEWVRLSNNLEEPWNIQGTQIPAISNLNSIYQEGNVAIGFKSNDLESSKKFEVKGDFKAAFSQSAQNVGIETSGFSTGTQLISLYNKNTQTAGLGSTIDMSTSNINLRSGRSSILNSSVNILNNRLSIGANNDVMGALRSLLNISLNPSSKEITLYSIASSSPILTGNHFKSEIILDGARGIKFNFNTNGASGNEVNTDSYMFPRTIGTKGQVLSVGEIPTGASYTQLEWKNVSELRNNKLNYSNQVQDTEKKWTNGASIKEATIEVILDNSINRFIIPKDIDLSSNPKIINARLIHQESTRIVNNVLSYNIQSRELIMEGESLPKGKYYLFLEFFENL